MDETRETQNDAYVDALKEVICERFMDRRISQEDARKLLMELCTEDEAISLLQTWNDERISKLNLASGRSISSLT